MLDFIIVFVVLCGILLIEELAWKKKWLHGEYQRKFLHIATGTFMAFWPWILSWTEIEILAIIGVASTLIYKKLNVFGGLDAIRHDGYGHFTHPLAVLVSAWLTHKPIYFCLAILVMALADGLAAIFGQRFGKGWQYKVFGYQKTVIGSMVFWAACVAILGVGLLFARDQISFSHYALLLIALPPVLTLLENLGVLGLDNILLPPAVIGALVLAQS